MFFFIKKKFLVSALILVFVFNVIRYHYYIIISLYFYLRINFLFFLFYFRISLVLSSSRGKKGLYAFCNLNLFCMFFCYVLPHFLSLISFFKTVKGIATVSSFSNSSINSTARSQKKKHFDRIKLVFRVLQYIFEAF